MIAAAKGNYEAAKEILDANVDVDAKDKVAG